MFPAAQVTLMAAAFVAQVTYLVVDSVLLDRPRRWYSRWYLFGCPWCFSAWVAFFVTAWVRPPEAILWWGAIWWLGLVAYFALQYLAVRAAEA